MDNIAHIATRFEEMEAKENLFQYEIAGVYIWPLIRQKVYKDILIHLGYASRKSAKKPPKKNVKLKNFLSLFFKKNKNVLIWTHNRRVEGKDIYTNDLIQNYAERAIIVETEGTEKSNYTNACSPFIFSAIAKLLSKIHDNANDKICDPMITLESIIDDYFNVKPSLKKEIENRYAEFKNKKAIYKLLLKLKKVRVVFLVVGYSYPYLIQAARENAIPVYELQHGFIGKYHLGYNYNTQSLIPYQPDKILLFGKYWRDTVKFASNVATDITGFPYFDKIRFSNLPDKKEKSILISSQFSTGTFIFDFSVKAAKLMPDFHFTFGVHPREDIEFYKSELENLTDMPANLTLLKSHNIYADIAEHEYQIGITSTTLYEGITLGTKVVLLNLPGIEHSLPLHDLYNAPLVSKPEELKEALENYAADLKAENFYSPADFSRYFDL